MKGENAEIFLSKCCFLPVNTGRTTGLKLWDKKDIPHEVRTVVLDRQFISLFENVDFLRGCFEG
jgi:hypothetical protein